MIPWMFFILAMHLELSLEVILNNGGSTNEETKLDEESYRTSKKL